MDVFAANPKFEPYWWEAVPKRTRREAALPMATDVAVVGAGYTGLSAALTLARGGCRVTVLEAREAGWGASTRNGGMMGLSYGAFTSVRKTLGIEMAKRLYAESAMAIDYVGKLIGHEKIDCRYAKVGHFRGASIPKHYDAMARELENARRHVPTPCYMVPKSEQRQEIGSDYYNGGVVNPDHAGLHPALYHAGLLSAAERAGATIIENTPVSCIARGDGKFALTTRRGEMTANEVLVATNGYTGPLTPQLRRRLVPVPSAIIATEPLAPDLMARLMPKKRLLAGSLRIVSYYRPSPDGTRILFGGRAFASGEPAADRVNARHLHLMLTKVFPELAATKVTHSWHGMLAFPFDKLPHVGQIDGLHYALGYCGGGVGRATWLGHKAALKIMRSPEGETIFDALTFQSRPFYHGRPWFLPATIAVYRIADALRL
jgi:glycine/D-amino acid oxidase-like deaminating enzyme